MPMQDLAERVTGALGSRYLVERELGRGGMATVYLARDLKHGRLVALKVLRPEVAATLGLERFLREIQVAAGLTHPHILSLHDSGEAEGLLYYVMPFIAGESLRDRLSREQRLEVEDALGIAREVADALDYAHHQGVVHRDIKPENILLGSGHALVADFGIARAIDAAGGTHSTLTQSGSVVGTPTYMSPEQVTGDPMLDARSDVYSLGCVLFEMLTGSPPFAGSTAQAILVRRLSENAPSLRSLRPAVPAAVEAAVARALAREPADRFPSAGALSAALDLWTRSGTALAALSPPLGATHGGEASIAVLPFANLSPETEDEYFSEGMTEELIHALTKVPQLRVASRTSAFAVHAKEQDVRAIGERLKVGTVLEGSVRRAGSRLRIAAQLIDAASGFHLWSETYDREMRDVFAVQEEISRAIVAKLRPQLTCASTLVKPATESVEAYHFYLRGRYFWNQRKPQVLQKGIEQFQRAIDIDPGFALGYAGLADSYAILAIYAVIPPHQGYPQAKVAARRALEINDLSAEAHTSLGCVAMCYEWDWATAEREFKRAIELEPRYGYAHLWDAWCLTAVGRADEAIVSARRAVELEPLALGINAAAGHILSFCGRHEEAIEQCERTLELDPEFTLAIEGLSAAYSRMGRYREGFDILREIPSSARVSQALRLGHLYARLGDLDTARHILEEEEARLSSGSAARGNASVYIALILNALGEYDRTFVWLERQLDERLFTSCFLKVDSQWSSLHHDRRFAALLARMGLGPDRGVG